MTPKRVEKVLTRHLDMKANDLTPARKYYSLYFWYTTKVVKCLNQCFAQLRFGKVSPAKQLLIHQVGFMNLRHFSNIEVVQTTDLRI